VPSISWAATINTNDSKKENPMSMWLDVVAVSPEAFRKIQKTPDLLDGVFFDEDEEILADLGIAEEDKAGVDYLSLSEALEAMSASEDEDEAVEPDFDPSGELDFSGGYDDAQYLDPAAIAGVLENETWSTAAEMDEDLGRLLKSASKNKRYLIFVVS
jgi:hypothetical protein